MRSVKERQLSGGDLLLVGFTLFSMFFGAGNLIFPPNVAAQAGTMTWPAMAGLAISAVGLPVLGVVAVARAGGLDVLGRRVHPLFARVFTIVAYLAIGPCLAIPRTATTSFEMAVPPFVGEGAPIGLYQLIYSLLFFAAALWIALRPEKLTDRLGKILCPILVALIVITFVGCLLNPLEGYGNPTGDYITHPVVKGFLEGYQTMDTIAALAFGIVIAVNIRARGIETPSAIVKGTVRAGGIAGIMLLAIYCMLAHIGALSGGAIPGPADGAEALTNIVGLLFGRIGNILLAGIFLIACFNVCVGLISSCGEYFYSICPKLSYRGWAVLFAVVSMIISNAGLTQIIAVSAPVLGAIYPVAIVLIALSFFQRWLEGKRLVYPVAVLLTGVFSILYALKGLGLPLSVLNYMPLASVGLGWVIPAAIGILLGLLLSKKKT
ncbi:branched-chain amino acid transport system II carrier protein [Flavonifractor hominis]|uniref:Branched-chain amino acid transport system carrier protein n=1 Tax=Flavonifractor hominis TaxID=3133178 RepID=A0ABV1EL39_9FIRM